MKHKKLFALLIVLLILVVAGVVISNGVASAAGGIFSKATGGIFGPGGIFGSMI